jgi:hypothetical protein
VTSCFPQRYRFQAVVKRSSSKSPIEFHSKPHPPQTRATHLKRLYRNCPPEMLWLPDFASGNHDRVLTFCRNFASVLNSHLSENRLCGLVTISV